MKAIQVKAHGGPEQLHYIDAPEPELTETGLLVQVLAAGINYIDTYQRSGTYPMELPFIPGLDGSGEVIAVGSQVSGFSSGDLVAWPSSASSYAEQILIPANRAVRVPKGLDPEIAAAAMLQGMTAHYLVNDTFRVQSGTRCLVHAAAGGVGLLLTQMIRNLGGVVFATASTPEKIALAKAAGANQVFEYEDFAKKVREATDGLGVDVVYDGVGKTTFNQSLESLARRGMMVLFGGASGPVPDFDLQRLNRLGSLFITRPTLADYIATDAELQKRASDLFADLAAKKLSFKIGARYPIADAAKAHSDLENRRTSGKLLLIP